MKKVLARLEDAAAQDVELLAFSETFLSGYPFWLELTGGARFDNPAQKRAYGLPRGGSWRWTAPRSGRSPRRRGIWGSSSTSVPPSEGRSRPAGTVFCTLVAIDPLAGVASTHRKLMPTCEERLVWGTGAGHGLPVHRYAGTRVGGLNCWENWMPQARHALYAQGEELHVSVWPGNPRNTADITRFVALVGRVFSHAANGLISLSDVPSDFPLYSEFQEAGVTDYCRSASAIAGPDGSWVVEPVVGEERS
jgi:nitrilase